jgi:hypothetical protein
MDPATAHVALIEETGALEGVYIHSGGGQSTRDLPPSVQRVVTAFDGVRSLGEVCALCGLATTKGVAVAHKLAERGLIRTADQAFDPVDEAFFCAEIAVELEEETSPTWRERLWRSLSRLRSRR